MNNNYQSGLTLVELMVTSAITIIIIGTATMLVSTGGRMYNTGWTQTVATIDTSLAAQRMEREIREAAYVTLSTDGTKLTYYSPQTDSSGNYLVPMIASTTAKYFQVTNGSLYWSDKQQPLLTNIQATDPTTSSSYTPFTNVYPGTILRGVKILICVRKTTPTGNDNSRISTTVYVRNLAQ